MTMHQRIHAAERGTGLREKRRVSKQVVRLILSAELFALDLAVILGTFALIGLLLTRTGRGRYELVTVALLIPIYAATAVNSGAYSINVLRRAGEGARRAITAFVLSVFTVLLVSFFLKSSEDISRLSIGASAVATMLVLGFARIGFHRHVRHLTKGQLINELVIVDGIDVPPETNGAQVVDAQRLQLSPDLTNPEMLHRFGALAKSFDRIVVASAPQRQARWALLLKGADIDGEILMEQANAVGAIGLASFCGRETMQVSRKPLSVPDRIKKRLLDLAITVPLLMVLLPLLVVVAVGVKLSSPGPILFKQDRVGRGNRLFQVLKFRSMRAEASDAAGARSASRDDDRVTPVRPLHPLDQHRRTASAVQRADRRHEPGRPAPPRARLARRRAAVLGSRRDLLAPSPAQARDHRARADPRASRRHLADVGPDQPAPGRHGICPGLGYLA